MNRKLPSNIVASHEHEKHVREPQPDPRDVKPPRRIVELAAKLQKLLDEKSGTGGKQH